MDTKLPNVNGLMATRRADWSIDAAHATHDGQFGARSAIQEPYRNESAKILFNSDDFDKIRGNEIGANLLY